MYGSLMRLVVFVLFVFAHALPSRAGELKTANVMAPLEVRDWGRFRQQLHTAKAMGVDAVSTDVWWGFVEHDGDQRFDWTYYDRLSDAIIGAGLKWVPILSFHSCGIGTEDDCDIPLPNWIWTHFDGVPAEDLKYRSERGHLYNGAVTLWADRHVMDEYRELMDAFEDHFASKVQHILEINISCGPNGELRYPSYDDRTDPNANFPQRGSLQCYGRLAREDFRRFALGKYGTLDAISRAWGSQLHDDSQIDVPDDPDGFFGRADYLDHAYGRDFTAWLNGSLVDHGRRMIRTAMTTFDHSMKDVELGIKIPGIHWRMGDPRFPRVAEVTAGLVPTDIDLNGESTSHGYAPLISMVAAFKNASHHVVLHFTCLEMPNDNKPPHFSQAEALVFWVAHGAAAQGVVIKGENALSGGITNPDGWNRIENVFAWSSYTGLTALRIREVTEDEIGHQRYRQFIRKFRR